MNVCEKNDPIMITTRLPQGMESDLLSLFSVGSSRRTSMRKSASNVSKSSGSGSAVDAEDLLDDL